MDKPYLNDVATLIKQFTAKVGVNGQAYCEITHSLHGLAWVVYQVGVSLTLNAPSPEVSAFVNSAPLTTSVVMGTANIANFPGKPPIAMVTAMVGPPYVCLEAGDVFDVSVIGAIAGDMLTVSAFVQEIDSPSLGIAANVISSGGYSAGYNARAGTQRW